MAEFYDHKPPLGPMPHGIWITHRILHLVAAMQRYAVEIESAPGGSRRGFYEDGIASMAREITCIDAMRQGPGPG